jgi:hypothetical protein
MVASRAISTSTGKPLIAVHGDHCAGHVLRPCFAPGRIRLHPRSLAVLSAWRDETRNALVAYSGEPHTTGHGAPPRARLLRRAAPPLLPSIKSEPFILNHVAQDHQYPFEGLFVKDTLPFPIIMPAVLGRFKRQIFFYLFQFI